MRQERRNYIKTKRLVFISCFAAATLIASPAFSAPRQKSMATSGSAPQRVAPRTSQVTSAYHYGGTRYYYGGFGYPYYGAYYSSSYPYSYYPYSSYYYSADYPYDYSYYDGPVYGYDGSVVAQVQSRLAELGYYDGVIDGMMGPQTRTAIGAYESTHNLVVDGMINAQLLRKMGLA
jgi:Putative peptidoglycan binding domain